MNVDDWMEQIFYTNMMGQNANKENRMNMGSTYEVTAGKNGEIEKIEKINKREGKKG
jgi:hypothetical protein